MSGLNSRTSSGLGEGTELSASAVEPVAHRDPRVHPEGLLNYLALLRGP